LIKRGKGSQAGT